MLLGEFVLTNGVMAIVAAVVGAIGLFFANKDKILGKKDEAFSNLGNGKLDLPINNLPTIKEDVETTILVNFLLRFRRTLAADDAAVTAVNQLLVHLVAKQTE